MKKFEFSLQKLLEYKNQILDAEKGIMAGLQSELGELMSLLQRQTESYEVQRRELSKLVSCGMKISEMVLHKNHIKQQQLQIEKIKIQIEEQKRKISEQSDVLIAIKTEISSLEKLREKQLNEYTVAERKSNELFIEEFVSNKLVAAV